MHLAALFYESSLRSLFPPVKFAFAYGSAVFQQQGRPKHPKERALILLSSCSFVRNMCRLYEQIHNGNTHPPALCAVKVPDEKVKSTNWGLIIGKMLDLVFVVDDPIEWHADNLQQNWRHYSFLRYLGTGTVARVQRYPAGLYYNTLVNIQSQLVKYGVISVEDLSDDLMQWRWLYISGRLHKPVLMLTDIGLNKVIEDGLKYNLRSAALCGVLLQENDIFTLEELFTTITSLSYHGDFRMLVGEDKNKIKNIIQPNMAEFERLYEPYLGSFVERIADGRMRKMGDVSLSTHFWSLPTCVQHKINQGQSLHTAIRSIVASSSIKQSVKGILTAGFQKTVMYSFEKLQKMARSIT